MFKELNNLFLYPNILIGNQLICVCVCVCVCVQDLGIEQGGMCCLPLAPPGKLFASYLS